MSVGNYGGVKNQLEQGVATLFNKTRTNQGVAITPSLLTWVLTRADLANTLNAKIAQPVLDATTSTALNVATAAAGQLVAVLIDNGDSAATYIQVFNASTATLATTVEILDLYCPATSQAVYIMPQPIAFATAIAWTGTTAAHGGTRNTTSTVSASLVWVA